jgi:hypothetical protein
MDDLTVQIGNELQRIEPLVEEITGLRSRWNGVVELIPKADFMGKKPFSCTILIDAALARTEARWRTLLHERLHAVSAGYTPSDYLAFLGWEEGVVEGLQRLLRPEILARLGVEVPDEVFHAIEAPHPFNRHIDALERMRESLSLPVPAFYLDLLRTPIRDRRTHLFGVGNGLPGVQRAAFVKVYSLSDAVLRR